LVGDDPLSPPNNTSCDPVLATALLLHRFEAWREAR
jgi:hypothetical protein